MNKHLSDVELQQYALGETESLHVAGCELCREQVAQYRQIINGITALPEMSFDFDVSEMVLTEKKFGFGLTVTALIIAGLSILATGLWSLKFLFDGTGALLAVTALLLLAVGLAQKYRQFQKINATFFNGQALISN